MSSKTFLTIPKQECQVVYIKMIENADQKWEAGIILGEKKDYGSAISIAIISIEELIKSIIVFLDGKGFEFRRVKGINIFFKNHEIRHVLAFVIFVMGVFGDELMKFIIRIKRNPEEINRLTNDMKFNKSDFEKKISYYLLRKLVSLKKEYEWFAKAEVFRQDGFYCNYEDQFKNPILINHDEYRHVIQRLEKVRIVTKGFIEAMNSDEEFYETEIKQMKIDFKKKGYYKKMGTALEKVKLSRENPFDFIKKSFLAV